MLHPSTLAAVQAVTHPRRSWLKRLGAVLGAGLLARPAAAPPQALGPQGTQDYQAYIGDIILVAFNFAPPGWQTCDGSLLPISEYEALFQLIGTTYGGDGQETFALPDLRGRIPVGMGSGPGLTPIQLGEMGGTEQVTLTTQQLARHTHRPADAASTNDPTSGYLAKATGRDGSGAVISPRLYTAAAATSTGTTSPAGGSQPQENMPPVLGMRYIISLFGVYPSQG